MKKINFIFLALFIIQSCAFAVDWVTVSTPLGKTAYLDKDSITEFDNYYFYNIKVINEVTGKDSVITVQSGRSKPFSARIKAYNPDEYEKLQGDYSNITMNITKNLEPVTSFSIVNSCYKKVKEIMDLDKIQISF